MFPQLAKDAEVTTLSNFFDDSRWVLEQKLDGHRVVLCSPGGDFPPTGLTRGGSPYTRGLPEAIRNFRFPNLGPNPHDWVLDGELVGGRFYVFDMPRSPILPEDADLAMRRVGLENVLARWDHPFHLVPQAQTREDKVRLADKALKNNFEGLVAKRRDSRYHPGARNTDWLKIKFVTTADCIVLAVRDDGKESVRLGMVDEKMNLVDVGRSSLIGKEKNGEINKGDVIEVRYLYTGANGRLYQPTIVRKRSDKLMHECTTDQMKHVNKEVLETL